MGRSGVICPVRQLAWNFSPSMLRSTLGCARIACNSIRLTERLGDAPCVVSRFKSWRTDQPFHILKCPVSTPEEFMAALLEAINVKRKMYFECENAPFYCLESEIATATARGGQT